MNCTMGRYTRLIWSHSEARPTVHLAVKVKKFVYARVWENFSWVLFVPHSIFHERILDLERNFEDAVHKYYVLPSDSKIDAHIVDALTDTKVPDLLHSVTCAILAPEDPRRSRLLEFYTIITACNTWKTEKGARITINEKNNLFLICLTIFIYTTKL